MIKYYELEVARGEAELMSDHCKADVAVLDIGNGMYDMEKASQLRKRDKVVYLHCFKDVESDLGAD